MVIAYRVQPVLKVPIEEEMLGELIDIRELLEELIALYKREHFYTYPGSGNHPIVTVPPDQ